MASDVQIVRNLRKQFERQGHRPVGVRLAGGREVVLWRGWHDDAGQVNVCLVRMRYLTMNEAWALRDAGLGREAMEAAEFRDVRAKTILFAHAIDRDGRQSRIFDAPPEPNWVHWFDKRKLIPAFESGSHWEGKSRVYIVEDQG